MRQESAPRIADTEERYYAMPAVSRRCAKYCPGSGRTDPHRCHGAGLRRIGRLGSAARMQHIDLFTWLRGDILVKADKITMANSWSCGCRSWTRRFSRRPPAAGGAKITRTTTGYAARRALEPVCARTLHRPKLVLVPIRHYCVPRAAGVYATVGSSQAGHLVDIAAVSHA